MSVIMIVFNAERSIEKSLQSVSWAQEIIIVDSYSSDKTVPVCRKFTDKIHQCRFVDFAAQKNFALSKATKKWVLSLDSDEVVTEKLASEIRGVIAKPASAGYRIPRKSEIFGRKFRFTGTQDDVPLRLFLRADAKFVQPIHETVEIRGAISQLKQAMLHVPFEGIAQYFEKLNRYTTLEAALRRSQGKIYGTVDAGLRPWLVFLKLFFLKQGFRDGWEGFLYSALSAAYHFVKIAKVIEGHGQAGASRG